MVDFLKCTLLNNPCKETAENTSPRKAWNSGKAQGKRKGFLQHEVEGIFSELHKKKRWKELAMFVLGVDTSLRSGNMMKLKVADICYKNGIIKDRFTVIQEKLRSKSKRKVECVLTAPTKQVLHEWLKETPKTFDDYLFTGREEGTHLSPDQHRRYVKKWARMIDLPDEEYSSHSLRRTKPLILYHLAGNDILVPQQILGHGSIKSTQEYLNGDTEKALKLAEETILFGGNLKINSLEPLIFT